MEEEEQRYPKAPEGIEEEVTGSVRMIKLLGDIIELYVTRFVDLFLSMMGGKKIQTETKEPQDDPGSISNDHPDKKEVE